MPPLMKHRIASTAISLAIVGALWYVMKLDKWLVATLAGAILLPLLFPYRFERLVSGLAYIGVAAFFYFYGGKGYAGLAALIALVGVGMMVYGAVKLRSAETA